MATTTTADQARDALMVVEREGQDPWPLVQSLLVQMVGRLDELEKEHGVTRKGARALAQEVKSHREIFQSLAQHTNGSAPPSTSAPSGVLGDVPTVGADGSPIDGAQAEAEAAMNAAAGPHPLDVNAGPRTNGGGRMISPPTVGADGSPLDAVQAAAEAAMDAAAGPRA